MWVGAAVSAELGEQGLRGGTRGGLPDLSLEGHGVPAGVLGTERHPGGRAGHQMESKRHLIYSLCTKPSRTNSFVAHECMDE